jgi:hypothetical protein
MNQDAILAALCDSRDDAKSLKEIALETGLDISSYVMKPLRLSMRPSRLILKMQWPGTTKGVYSVDRAITTKPSILSTRLSNMIPTLPQHGTTKA